MKITYDPRYNIAYIKFLDKTNQVETIRISDEMNLDIAPNGVVYGIELLNANDMLMVGDDGNLIVTNEALNQSTQVRFAS